MAYVRFGKKQNFYIWAGINGLNVLQAGGNNVQFNLDNKNDTKAAEALLEAVQDHLEAAGRKVKRAKVTKR